MKTPYPEVVTYLFFNTSLEPRHIPSTDRYTSVSSTTTESFVLAGLPDQVKLTEDDTNSTSTTVVPNSDDEWKATDDSNISSKPTQCSKELISEVFDKRKYTSSKHRVPSYQNDDQHRKIHKSNLRYQCSKKIISEMLDQRNYSSSKQRVPSYQSNDRHRKIHKSNPSHQNDDQLRKRNKSKRYWFSENFYGQNYNSCDRDSETTLQNFHSSRKNSGRTIYLQKSKNTRDFSNYMAKHSRSRPKKELTKSTFDFDSRDKFVKIIHSLTKKRKPNNKKFTLGKYKIKCLQNNVKKDILGENNYYNRTPIDSDLTATISTIDFDNHFMINTDKSDVKHKMDKNSILTTQPKLERYHDGHGFKLSNPYFDHTETSSHYTSDSYNDGQKIQSCNLQSLESNENRRHSKSLELNLTLGRQEKVELKRNSDSSISTIVMKNIKSTIKSTNESMKQNSDKYAITSGIVSKSTKPKNVLKFPYYYYNNKIEDNKGRKKIKQGVEKLKGETRKGKIETKQKPRMKQHPDDKTKSPHYYKHSMETDRKGIKPQGGDTNTNEQEQGLKKTGKCRKKIQRKPINRIVCNTLHVKNQYLELKYHPESSGTYDNVELFLPQLNCPPTINASTNITEKIAPDCTQSPKKEIKNETFKEKNRALLMKKINELISSENKEGEEEKKVEHQKLMNQTEKKQTFLNSKLVESIILQNQNGVADDKKSDNNEQESEDIFKSHCDVYYINKARNFKRKKLSGLGSKDRCNPFDDIFNDINCQTVYVNKARRFEKKITDIKLK